MVRWKFGGNINVGFLAILELQSGFFLIQIEFLRRLLFGERVIKNVENIRMKIVLRLD